MMKIKYKHLSTAQKEDAYLEAYPGEFQNVMAGSQFFGDEVVWDLAFDALQQGKKVIFEPSKGDSFEEMIYRYE